MKFMKQLPYPQSRGNQNKYRDMAKISQEESQLLSKDIDAEDAEAQEFLQSFIQGNLS